MKVHSDVPVKSGGKVVELIEVEEFETIQEAVDFHSGKEAPVLKLINTQYATNKKNQTRGLYNAKPSKKALFEKAKDEILILNRDENAAWVEELTQAVGDHARQAEIYTRYIKETMDIDLEGGDDDDGGNNE